MGQSVFTGPIVSAGGFAGAPRGGPPAEYSVEIGPSIFWQGLGLLAMDGRGSKDAKGMGAFPALFMSDTVVALNQVIQPAGLALTQAANPASGVSLPITPTYAAGRGPGAPYGGALGVAIEPGFAVVGVTAASGNVTVQANDKWRFWPGQFLSIAGAGAGWRFLHGCCLPASITPAPGAMLMTQVTAVGTGNTLTISPPAAVTQAAAQAGLYTGDPSKYGFTLPINYGAMMNGGAGRFLLPDCACTRGVGVTGVAGGSGGQVLIQGLDYLMRAQSEMLTVPAGAGTVYGKKTYKMLLAAIPQYTNANNLTVVTSDLIGLPISLLPNWPPPVILEAGVARTGDLLQYADLTNPATTATGDPRGAIQLSAAGPGAGTGATPDGVSRFVIEMTLNPAQVLAASQFNPGPLFGVAPV
jgi:hypothetical protein